MDAAGAGGETLEAPFPCCPAHFARMESCAARVCAVGGFPVLSSFPRRRQKMHGPGPPRFGVAGKKPRGPMGAPLPFLAVGGARVAIIPLPRCIALPRFMGHPLPRPPSQGRSCAPGGGLLCCCCCGRGWVLLDAPGEGGGGGGATIAVALPRSVICCWGSPWAGGLPSGVAVVEVGRLGACGREGLAAAGQPGLEHAYSNPHWGHSRLPLAAA